MLTEIQGIFGKFLEFLRVLVEFSDFFFGVEGIVY
jgi:hypothetical protein